MLEPAVKRVALPGGDTVMVSYAPLPWWGEANASGYVDPRNIAPDMDNPRKHMNEARLLELNASIKARGVRQQLVVVPRHTAPWVRVSKEHANCYFVAVSGHRRRNGALEGGVGAVPIRVAIYADEKAHRMDMSLLNKGQDDLTELEEGYEILRLQELGWRVNDIADAFGVAIPQFYCRINLTKLAPDIQAMLDADLPRDKRLSVTVGGHLGGVKTPTTEELEISFHELAKIVRRETVTDEEDFERLSDKERCFTLQRLLLAVIRQRNLTSVHATEFIRDRALKLKAAAGVAGRQPERFQPQRRKDIINTLVNETVKSVVADWPPDEIRRIFSFASREEVETFVARVLQAEQTFRGLREILERIKNEKKPTPPEVLRLVKSRA